MKRNAIPSKARTMPAISTHQGVVAFPVALAGVEVPVGVDARAAVAAVEGVVLCGVDRVVEVEVACCLADARVAVKENVPLTG